MDNLSPVRYREVRSNIGMPYLRARNKRDQQLLCLLSRSLRKRRVTSIAPAAVFPRPIFSRKLNPTNRRASVVMLEDFSVALSLTRHDRCADLTQTHAMSPTSAAQNEVPVFLVDHKCRAV